VFTYIEYRAVSVVFRTFDCQRPIQCLASSEILFPYPLTARRVCNPRLLVRAVDTLAGWRGGGDNISEDARHWIGLLQYNPSTVGGNGQVQ
jgi:hypothetical protein